MHNAVFFSLAKILIFMKQKFISNKKKQICNLFYFFELQVLVSSWQSTLSTAISNNSRKRRNKELLHSDEFIQLYEIF